LPADGEMSGVDSATSTDSSLLVTMLFRIIYLIGR
jgi:hypothetical protein